jgi:hypothetical protein
MVVKKAKTKFPIDPPDFRIWLILWAILVIAFSILTPKYEITDAGFHIPSILCFGVQDEGRFCENLGLKSEKGNFKISIAAKPICQPRVSPRTETCVLNNHVSQTYVTLDPEFLKLSAQYSSLNFTSQFYYYFMHFFVQKSFTDSLLLMSLFNLFLLVSVILYLYINLDKNSRAKLVLFLYLVGTPITIGLLGSIHPSSWTISGLILYFFAIEIRRVSPEKRHTLVSISLGAVLVIFSLRWGILLLLVSTIAVFLSDGKPIRDKLKPASRRHIFSVMLILMILMFALVLIYIKIQNWSVAFSNGNQNSVIHQIMNMDKTYIDLVSRIFGFDIESEKASYFASYRVSFPTLLIGLYTIINLLLYLYLIFMQTKKDYKEFILLSVNLLFFIAIGLLIPLFYAHFYGNGVVVQSHHVIPYFLVFNFILSRRLDTYATKKIIQKYFVTVSLVLYFGVLEVITYFRSSYQMEFQQITAISWFSFIILTLAFIKFSLITWGVNQSQKGTPSTLN